MCMNKRIYIKTFSKNAIIRNKLAAVGIVSFGGYLGSAKENAI